LSKQHNKLEYYNCFIQPGQVVYSQDPSLICAVCGNGVVVVIYDRIKNIGGAVHCIYPKLKKNQRPTNYHVDNAINSLVASLKVLKASGRTLEAQLFGGGCFRGYEKKRAEQVIRKIRRVLKKLKIEVISEDLGGVLGRKIVFNTYSGEVIVHKTRKVRKTDWMPEYQRKSK